MPHYNCIFSLNKISGTETGTGTGPVPILVTDLYDMVPYCIVPTYGTVDRHANFFIFFGLL